MLGLLKMPIIVTVQVDVVLTILTALGVGNRLWGLMYPRAVVFDEVYYGQFVSLYMKQMFFIDDSGPPLGHMILAVGDGMPGFLAPTILRTWAQAREQHICFQVLEPPAPVLYTLCMAPDSSENAVP